jgi:hypothetical protein
MELFKSYFAPVDLTTNDLQVNVGDKTVPLEIEISQLIQKGYEIKHFNSMPYHAGRMITVWLHKA